MSKDLVRNWWGAAWVEKMERLAEPRYREMVRTYLEDPSISPRLVQRLAGRRPEMGDVPHRPADPVGRLQPEDQGSAI